MIIDTEKIQELYDTMSSCNCRDIDDVIYMLKSTKFIYVHPDAKVLDYYMEILQDKIYIRQSDNLKIKEIVNNDDHVVIYYEKKN